MRIVQQSTEAVAFPPLGAKYIIDESKVKYFIYSISKYLLSACLVFWSVFIYIFPAAMRALWQTARAMEAQLEETKKQLIRERIDKEKLEEKVSRLQKALKKKDINLIRKL